MNIDNEQVEISNYFDTLIKCFKKNKKLSFLKLLTAKKELIILEKKLRNNELIQDIEEENAIVKCFAFAVAMHLYSLVNEVLAIRSFPQLRCSEQRYEVTAFASVWKTYLHN